MVLLARFRETFNEWVAHGCAQICSVPRRVSLTSWSLRIAYLKYRKGLLLKSHGCYQKSELAGRTGHFQDKIRSSWNFPYCTVSNREKLGKNLFIMRQTIRDPHGRHIRVRKKSQFWNRQYFIGTEKRATRHVQLVLQYCCKTSWIAMLRVFPPTFKPVNNLICCKTGLMWVVKRATSLFNSFCSNIARQVACVLLPVFPYP